VAELWQQELCRACSLALYGNAIFDGIHLCRCLGCSNTWLRLEAKHCELLLLLLLLLHVASIIDHMWCQGLTALVPLQLDVD
jgi:hypothetical protein